MYIFKIKNFICNIEKIINLPIKQIDKYLNGNIIINVQCEKKYRVGHHFWFHTFASF